MPKSKVRKKDPAVAASIRNEALKTARPARALAPSPTWYPVVMGVILVIGLAYLVTYYLASDQISLMSHLGAWNFAVGFGILVAGLIMAVRWR